MYTVGCDLFDILYTLNIIKQVRNKVLQIALADFFLIT